MNKVYLAIKKEIGVNTKGAEELIKSSHPGEKVVIVNDKESLSILNTDEGLTDWLNNPTNKELIYVMKIQMSEEGLKNAWATGRRFGVIFNNHSVLMAYYANGDTVSAPGR